MNKRILLILLVSFPFLFQAQGAEIAMGRLSQSISDFILVVTLVAFINPVLLIAYLISKKGWLSFPLAVSIFIGFIVGFMLYNGPDNTSVILAVILFISGITSMLVLVWREILKPNHKSLR